MAGLLRGEICVVLAFISSVLFSTPPALFYEAASLCLLAVAALLVEIRVECSAGAVGRFRTRQGASSGILLGAVTLPAVMLSRLIQASRLLSVSDVRPEEIWQMSVQYWAAGMTCFSVILFIFLLLRHSFNSPRHFYWCPFQQAVPETVCIVSYAVMCYLSPTVRINDGEALLVSSGLILYFGDMLTYTIAKIDPFMLLSKSYLVYGNKSHINIVIQGYLLCLLLLPVFHKCFLHSLDSISIIIKSRTQIFEGGHLGELGRSILFYASLAFLLFVLAPLWMELVQSFDVHPILWVFTFIFSEPLERLLLCVYWIGIIFASVIRFYGISKHSKIERILLRKYYHLVAVLMFLPALVLQPEFLDLAFGAALVAFLALEIVRVWRIWPLGYFVHEFMNAFTDHRDSDVLIVSHFSLLLGCALPKWLSLGPNDRPLAPFAGILSLGIGDTMASVVGHKYGVLRWSKSGKKTIVGTAAGITSVLAACSILVPFMASSGYILSQHWLSLLWAVTVSGLLEAYTTQLDNAFIPLVFYSLLCL